jgi:transcriptional regulator with GAF, ATPase, and Fis domain
VEQAGALGELIGQSPIMERLKQTIKAVAASDYTVLIQGESGTGKEVVARAVHRLSVRSAAPMISVNCPAIPEQLLESELFGHVKGAFTGALRASKGLFLAAQAGTILLDEIGDIPGNVQTKLLRVLQESEVRPVGGSDTVKVDVRIIASTNQHLEEKIKDRSFREDLFYRLNVFPIQVPPLRERMDDIPLLANHFVELSAKDLKCAKPRLTRAAVAKLQNYEWPGNIRELRNVIERAVILARGGALDFDLPVATSSAPAARSSVRSENSTDSVAQPKFLTEAELQRRERDNLVQVLEAANWKIGGPEGAAELLGVKPTTLLSRMDKWGIKKPER